MRLSKKNNHVAFEIDCEHKLMSPLGKESCTTSFAYESVIGQGVIEKAAEEEKEPLLTELLRHYALAILNCSANHTMKIHFRCHITP